MGKVTILGQSINVIRPRKVAKPVVGNPWKPKVNTRPIDREIGIAEFFKLCLTIDDPNFGSTGENNG